MAKRLVELYKVGDKVKVTFGDGHWWLGEVIGLDHPGIWVAIQGGGLWFVTNAGRIQMADP
jgi:hypothetical protein